MRLAVILSNYNHGKYLPECMLSILNQTRKADEIIIIDDASSDNSVDLLRKYEADYPGIKLICNKQNRGYLYNAAAAFEIMDSEYFFAASADDIYFPTLFEKSMSMLEASPDAGLCSSVSLVLDRDDGRPGLFPIPVFTDNPVYLNPEQSRKYLFRYGSWFLGNTTINSRKAYEEMGGYNAVKELYSMADGFLSEMIAFRYGVCFVPEPMGIWRRTGEGISDTDIINLDKYRHMVQSAGKLMRGRYRDFVPHSYALMWESNAQFSLERKLIKSEYSRIASSTNIMSPRRWSGYLKFITGNLSAFIRHFSPRLVRRYASALAFSIKFHLAKRHRESE